MKLVLSGSEEVAGAVASTRALACRVWPAPALVCIATAFGMLVAFPVYLIASLRAAAWIGVPVALALNVYLLWRGRYPRLNWLIAGCDDRLFVRLFVPRGKDKSEMKEPDVAVFEASEIASMRARTIEVFLYGPKPQCAEWAVIEPVRTVADSDSWRMCQLPKQDSLGKQVYVTNEEEQLAVSWRFCHPDLQTFLQQIARECPSIFVGPDEHSELDLNGIWNGLMEKPSAQQRQLLIQANRLGFGHKCAQLLSLYRSMSLQEASAYLAEIERAETGTEPSAGCSICR